MDPASPALNPVRERDYRDLQLVLERFPDFERGASPGSVPFRLDRTRALLDDLRRPDLRYRRVHVVGTKGKGSTTAMLASILQQSALRVGAYTSPHLHALGERIQVDGRPVPQADLLAVYTSRVQPAIDRLPPTLGRPTYFEVMTILSLEAFSAAGVQVAVIEAGLGGRLDATNAIMAPDVIVVVPISLDHTQILGSTVERIAWDKTAVFKPGSKIVAARQIAEVAAIVTRQAESSGCSISWVPSEIHVRRHPDGTKGQRLRMRVGDDVIDVQLPLAGPHQADNAATAALAAEVLWSRDVGHSSLAQELRSVSTRRSPRASTPMRLYSHAVKAGLESVRLRGRFECVSSNPPVILDVAHNEASARSLAATVAETLAGKVVYVIGLSRDKDANAFINALAGTAIACVFVQADHPRARDAKELATVAESTISRSDNDAPGIATAASVEQGLHAARNLAGGSAIVVTGSFYVVADALNVLDARATAAAEIR